MNRPLERGSPADIAARERKLAAEVRQCRLDVDHYNDAHPDQERIDLFDEIDVSMSDAEIISIVRRWGAANRNGVSP